MIDEILSDFSASYWLKNALQSALSRDPVDALRDAEILVIALRERVANSLPTSDSDTKTL